MDTVESKASLAIRASLVKAVIQELKASLDTQVVRASLDTAVIPGLEPADTLGIVVLAQAVIQDILEPGSQDIVDIPDLDSPGTPDIAEQG